jgi:hypothetical protein
MITKYFVLKALSTSLNEVPFSNFSLYSFIPPFYAESFDVFFNVAI